ncbi:MAG TPA: response regulator transcription factor [Patescibacteria group bacterium]|nr:response regulator transcription factor [Patescibacteria group bacterium]
MNLLLVEDDKELLASLSTQLQSFGFVVERAMTAEDGVFLGKEVQYDCIVLDIGLPDGSGLDVCKKLREQHIHSPILMLTARGDVRDRVEGLNVGADDYLAKPADVHELVARIRALVRRNTGHPSPIIIIGDLTIRPNERAVSRSNRSITLPSKEYAVLEYLAYHHDEVVTRTMLMEHVWGSDFETVSNVVDVYIRNLRKKIDRPGKKSLIHTIRGGGYMISARKTE